jgi:hypothetical protein
MFYDIILVSRGGTRKSNPPLLSELREVPKGQNGTCKSDAQFAPLPLTKTQEFSKKFLTTATKCGIIKEQ